MNNKLSCIVLFLMLTQILNGQNPPYVRTFEETCKQFFEEENYSRAFLCFSGIKTASTNNNDNTYKEKSIDWMEKSARKIAQQIHTADSLIDLTKNFLDNFYFYDNRLALAYKDRKYGYIDRNGRAIIPFIFEYATNFDDSLGYAEVVVKDPAIRRKGTSYVDIYQGEYRFWMDPFRNYFPIETPLDSLPKVYKLTSPPNTQNVSDVIKVDSTEYLSQGNPLHDAFNQAIDSYNAGQFADAYLKLQAVATSAENGGLTELVDKSNNLRNKFINGMDRLYTNKTRGLDAAQQAVKSMEAVKNSYYYYDGKYALVNNNAKYWFIGKDGQNFYHLGLWDKARQFDHTGFARVQNEGKNFLLNTEGETFPLALSVGEINDSTKAVDLRGVFLQSFPDKILEFPQLEVIILDGNPQNNNTLGTIPESINNLDSLQFISMRYCSLTGLPASIGELANLNSLDVYSNNLKDLPAEIGSLQKLMVLNAGNNLLSEIPEELWNCVDLKSIFLTQNLLAGLPDGIDSLKQLELLYLQDNPVILDTAKLDTILPQCNILLSEELKYNDLADKFFKVKNYQSAYENIVKATEQRRAGRPIWYARSYYALFSDKPGDAVEAADKTLQLSPRSESVLTNKALGYLLSGQWNKAKSIYEEWKGKEFSDERKLADELFLRDIEDLEAAGIKHPDFAKVKKLFGL